MRKTVMILLVLVGALFSVKCAFCGDSNAVPAEQKAAEPKLLQNANEVVMVFDGNELTVGQLRYFNPQLTPDTAKEIANYWLDTQLLYEEMIKKGMDKNPKTKFIADLECKKVFADVLVEKIISDVKIDDEQVKKYYDKNKDTDLSLKDPMFLSFSHVVVNTLETAEEVLKRLNKGEDINELAKELSVAYDAQQGGTVVKLRKDSVGLRYGKEFLDALLNATEGQIIGPIKNNESGKYEIARHEGKKNPRVKDLDANVSGMIKAKLEDEAKKNAFESLMKRLREDAKTRYIKKGVLSEEKIEAKGEKKSE